MSPKRLNILLADDGSEHAQAAVALIQSLPLPEKSRIQVLRAFGPGQIDALPGFERALERTRSQLQGSGFQVKADMLLGYPAEMILDYAEKNKPSIIVMGAKGLRATLGILLGGVAQQVVEYANCPVLVVRAPFRGLRRVLLAIDESTYSQQATRYLSQFPLPEQADLRVIHVLPPQQQPIMMEPYFGGWQTSYMMAPSEEEETAILEKQAKAGEALLARTSSLLARHGLRSTPVAVRGDAATEIIEYVKSEQIDLVVVGSRGVSQFRSFLMGSVTRKLVHYSSCSVLVVKAPKKE